MTREVLEEAGGIILVGSLTLGSLFLLYKGLEECKNVIPKRLYDVPIECRR